MMRRSLLTMIPAAVAKSASAVDSLLSPMNEFAKAYNDFTEAMRHGIFDVRQARRLSKLWREVERSGSWPEVK
jgi:hypothetical protein